MSDPTIRPERMSDAMMKFHIDGLPFGAVLHRFTLPDTGDPHDHPWGFWSTILYGGYLEDVYDSDGGYLGCNHRKVGDSFYIKATHIHRIVNLLGGECWTLILPGPWERKSGFWQFRDDGSYYRDWDQEKWTLVK